MASFSPYPVIEGDMPKLTGKANYQNYDTHFIPVSPKNPTDPNEVNYFPCKPGSAHTYTEVVVFDSAACLPRYLVELKPITTKKSAPKAAPISQISPLIPKSPPSAQQIPAAPTSLKDYTKIYAALESKDYKTLAELLYAADPSLKRDKELADRFEIGGWDKLEVAIILGELDRVQALCRETPALLEKKDIRDRSLLHIAAGWGSHLLVIQWLVGQKSSFLLKTSKVGWTCLHHAALEGHLEVVQWLVAQERSLLLKTENDGSTCLHLAAQGGHLEVVQWLVAQEHSLLLKTMNDGMTSCI